MTIKLLPYMDCDTRSFEWLANVAQNLNGVSEQEIVFSGPLNWCDAQLCAPFGAILFSGLQNLNTYRFDDVKGNVLKIWAKNGFWQHFGGARMADEYDTTLAFGQFEVGDEKRFATYIQRELMPKELPPMNDSAKHRFRNSIQEVFNNGVTHSRTEQGVFTCGQRYPSSDRLTFAVADLGVGFRRNLEDYLGQSVKSTDAIGWAVMEGNTTKRGSIPGGLGLTWLVEFMDGNGGDLLIVSHEGFWKRSGGQTETQDLSSPFPGTVVVLDIRTEVEVAPATGRMEKGVVT